MTEPAQFASSFTLKEANIYPVLSEKPISILDLITRFDYFEDIRYPSVSGKLRLLDNAANLISSMPIQGFEKVEIKLIDFTNENVYEYNFRVYKIEQRFEKTRFQVYTLDLVSEENLINEGVRVPKTLEGKAEDIISGLITSSLGSEKVFRFDPTEYKLKFNPGIKSPFTIINSIQMKCVPSGSKSKVETSEEGSDSSNQENKSQGLLGTVESGEYSKAKGTGGYLFYENRFGYNFKSIDTLCSTTSEFNGEEAVTKYTLEENYNREERSPRKILDIDFLDELDIASKLRMGAFSSLVVYFNFSTGQYEEYVYSLAESYKNMAHMGNQKGLPYGQKELSKYPTRIMSSILDDETWYNGSDIGSIEEKHNGGKTSGTQFPDFQKYYLSQSLSRLNSLQNQKVKITVPGNPDLTVGDKIELDLPNQTPVSTRIDEPYDIEYSGVYLVQSINHAFSPKDQICTTYVTLIRDSYGKLDSFSKTK